MSSPTASSGLVNAPTIRKRRFNNVVVDESEMLARMSRRELIPLSLSTLIKSPIHIDSASGHPIAFTSTLSELSVAPRRAPRVLPALFYREKQATPPSSEISSQESVMDDSPLGISYAAKFYLEKRIPRADAERCERHELEDRTPESSQYSNEVSYSQDSQLSGAEPPPKRSVVTVMANHLSEERLQQLFGFGNMDHLQTRVDIITTRVDRDVKFFLKLIDETIRTILENDPVFPDAPSLQALSKPLSQ
jgi:hypothetical protein